MADWSDLMKLEQKPKASPATQPAVAEKAHKTTTPQVSLPTSPQTSLPTRPLNSKVLGEVVEKYTTHLKPSVIKKIKVYAVEQDIPDYEVVCQALEEFFSRRN